jgi:hypothetical protein
VLCLSVHAIFRLVPSCVIYLAPALESMVSHGHFRPVHELILACVPEAIVIADRLARRTGASV